MELLQYQLVSVRTFGVMYAHTFSNLANHQLEHQRNTEWVVSLVTAYDHFNLPASSVCVGIWGLTY